MKETDLLTLKNTLRTYNKAPARVNFIDPGGEEPEKELKNAGELVLTSNHGDQNLTYIALADYVDELEADGKHLDPVTLKFLDKPYKAPKITALPPEDHCGFCDFLGTKQEVDDHIAANHPAPEIPATAPKEATEDGMQSSHWIKKQLDVLSYRDLQKLAKLWDDVPGVGKDEMIEGLIGKPKSV